jgi:hypothetical protein
MIEIEVFPDETQIRIRQAGQRSFHYQQAYLHVPGQRFPRAIQLPMREDAKPYPAGLYTLAAESVLVNQYQSLELSRFNQTLEPIERKA